MASSKVGHPKCNFPQCYLVNEQWSPNKFHSRAFIAPYFQNFHFNKIYTAT